MTQGDEQDGIPFGRCVQKIVSGGQTGVDTAALEFARANGIPYGGWVPKGRTNEDGLIPAHLSGLVETKSEDVAERTRLNVFASDATLVFIDGSDSPGTLKTVEFAVDAEKPHLVVDIRKGKADCAQQMRTWLSAIPVTVLNIAGPRASEAPEIGPRVHEVLDACLDQFIQPK